MVKLKSKNMKKKENVSVQSKKDGEDSIILPPVRMSDDPAPKQVRITILVFIRFLLFSGFYND